MKLGRLDWKRTGALVLATACLSAVVPVQAGSAKSSRDLLVTECAQQQAMVPIPRDQAKSMLPPGYEPSDAPAGTDDALINFWVTSVICGNEDAPSLRMYLTHVGVVPPKKLAREGAAHEYIVDAGASGPLMKKVRDHLCVGNLFEGTEIEGAYATTDFPAGITYGETSIESRSLSASITMSGGGAGFSNGSEDRRWLYGSGKRIKAFDVLSGVKFFNIGEATVVFGEAYRGLPQATGSFGVFIRSDYIFEKPKGCK